MLMHWLVLMAGFCIFAAGVVMSFKGLGAEATGTYAAAVFCLIFAFLSRFKRFKGLGIEGELWEEKQEQAAALIDRLRRLAVATAQPILTMAPRMGRLGQHLKRGELHEAVRKIEFILREAGISENLIDNLKQDYHFTTVFEMSREIERAITVKIHEKLNALGDEAVALRHHPGDEVSAEQVTIIGQRRHDLSEAHRKLTFIPPSKDFEQTPAALEAAIAQLPEFSEEEKKAFFREHRAEFEDLKYYAREKKIRDGSAWLAAEE